MSGMLTTPEEFANFEGGTGNYRSQDIENALAIAELIVEDLLNSPLVPCPFTEEYPYPEHSLRLQLVKRRVNSIDTVVGLHTLDCDCAWETITGCGVVLNREAGDIQLQNCAGALSGCWPCRCPRRIRVTYTAGFTASETQASSKIGRAIRAAVFNMTLAVLFSSVGFSAAGTMNITSWSSAGYSESREFGEMSAEAAFTHPLYGQAVAILKAVGLIKKRFVSLHSAKGPLR